MGKDDTMTAFSSSFGRFLIACILAFIVFIIMGKFPSIQPTITQTIAIINCSFIGFISAYIFGKNIENKEPIQAKIEVNNDDKIEQLCIGKYKIQGFNMIAKERSKSMKVEYADLNKAIYKSVVDENNLSIANFLSLNDAKAFINLLENAQKENI